MIRILIADDSAVIRSFLRKTLSDQPEMHVVDAVADGAKAVEAYKIHKPDVVILDQEMPVLNGIGALTQILALNPRAKILMCSALTAENTATTLKALELGAADYITKPSNAEAAVSLDNFTKTLIQKVMTLHRPYWRPPVAGAAAPSAPQPNTPVTLRPMPMLFNKPDIIAIGSSTGGVQALSTVLRPLQQKLNVPIVITQHMPSTFTGILSDHIRQHTSIPTFEASEGMPIEKGQIYVAPGGYHLELVRKNDQVVAHLSDAPPENFCRPAVDPMFRSVLNTYGRNILGVILTGMGSDGLAGVRHIVEHGSSNLIIAQDEASSVVWGMPGAVAKAGLCHLVLPVDKIGDKIAAYL